MVTRQQRLDDFDSAGEPQRTNRWNCFAKITMALTCFLFPVGGLMAYGAALGPTIRLMPMSLGGEGNRPG